MNPIRKVNQLLKCLQAISTHDNYYVAKVQKGKYVANFGDVLALGTV